MSGPEGYTGPTSGRITVGGDGSVNRERFYDRPLTREEQEAVKWFTDLSPNEQLREVQRMKFNLESIRRDRDTWKAAARQADAENRRLTAERDARRPDGYELPRSASQLLLTAREHGWGTAVGWYPDEDGQHARLAVLIRRGGWAFKLAWAVPRDGNGAGSRNRAGLFSCPGRGWSDAPSFKEITRLLTLPAEE